ncbi:MAG TPA: hypothetical protein DD733_05660, partial [Clostridiales bacterium]|nr:hypothetical protein [Clostridiales bacterium]
YLKNAYFINGTAFAGKSTMCAMLAKKYDMIHCEENYNMEMILSVVTEKDQPNMNYFNSKRDWQEFLNRTPDEYERWINGNEREVMEFEIAELIRISSDKKTIVDTNIPCDVLREISDYGRVAIMVSPQQMSVDRFFDREDPDKQFLLSEIQKTENPQKTLNNFRECIARINSKKYYDEFMKSGFFTIVRKDSELDTREETLKALEKHFGLEK